MHYQFNYKFTGLIILKHFQHIKSLAGLAIVWILFSTVYTGCEKKPSRLPAENNGIFKVLDQPYNIDRVFHPIKSPAKELDGAFLYNIPVDKDITIGARLHLHSPDFPTLLFFHGNSESINDYRLQATRFKEQGFNLFAVEYRGYGWSKGSPGFQNMIEDAKIASDFLEKVIAEKKLNRSIFVMGRSLGSVPAIRLVYRYPESYSGLILESAFADATSLISLFRLKLDGNMEQISRELSNHLLVKEIDTPLLIIHGENDRLIPVKHAMQNYEISQSEPRILKIIPDAGHNNLILNDSEYYPILGRFRKEVMNSRGNQIQ